MRKLKEWNKVFLGVGVISKRGLRLTVPAPRHHVVWVCGFHRDALRVDYGVAVGVTGVQSFLWIVSVSCGADGGVLSWEEIYYNLLVLSRSLVADGSVCVRLSWCHHS